MAERAGRRSETWHPGCCPDLHYKGLKIAHCASCHETFGGPHAFDAHKLISGCREPSACGMVRREETGIWHWPPRESLIKWLAKV